MFYRILAALLVSALIYVTYEFYTAKSAYNTIYTPPRFMAMNAETGTIPVVQFLDLHCATCKNNALVTMEYAEKNSDILFILRPVYNGEVERYYEVRVAIAAGMQNRYWEMMRTISMHNGALDNAFYQDNAALMDIDLKQLEIDVESEQARKMTAENTKAFNKSGIKSVQSLMVGDKIYYLQKPLTEDDLSRIVESARQAR
jgi:hypothetical protein